MASKCRKFVPNMFNKTKCQACFGSKEAHSAAALENNKISRKVSKCGYLFVSPDFDFSNPLDRTRRWQRRFFRLFDDGELTYSVDDHADTVPQGAVDMNKCTEILDAEVITTHPNSIAVVTPEKTEYFKADSREEIQWWHDVLAEFPNKLNATKNRRKPNYILSSSSSNKENVQPSQDPNSWAREQLLQGRFQVEKVRAGGGKADLPAYATFKGVRSLKHKYDKHYQDGMRKSSSLHDLSTQDKDMAASLAASRFLSCSGDGLDALTGGGRERRSKSTPGFSSNPYFTIPRTSWPSRVHPCSPILTTPAAHPSLFNSSSSLSSTSSAGSALRESFEDRPGAGQKARGSRRSRERSSSLKDFPTQLTLPRESGSLENIERRAGSVGGSGLRAEAEDLSQSMSNDDTDSNETDELKMQRSSELGASSRVQPPPPPPASSNPEASPTKYEDLVYMKKGWLIKQGPSDRESRKHWFVLAGNSLRYYKDAKAEESNSLDGRIDLSTCFEVSEVPTPRNYGFKIKTRNGEYVLAAMTSGIRNNWMKAVRLCMDLHSSAPKLGVSTSLTGKALAGLSARAMDDFEVGGGAAAGGASAPTTSTLVVTGAKGETAFQLVGRRDPAKKDGRNARRHHSDVNPGNVSKLFSVKEFTASLDAPLHPAAGDSAIDDQQSAASMLSGREKTDASPRASKIPRHHSPSSESVLWSQDADLPFKRYVEGSDSLVAAPVTQGGENRRSKRNMAGDGNKEEEEKREMMRRAKSPSARIKEKSRSAKTPRLHSPPPEDEGFEYHHRSPVAGQGDACSIVSDTEDDMDMTLSSEEHYHYGGGADEADGGHSDSLGEGSMMVEILESEVESLKERLDHTQTQLVKMHETNIDLKTRLHKESNQSMDSSGGGHSGRWSQHSTPTQIDPSQLQTLKRQLKEAKDTVQKQRMEIETLKSKLDMSVSKLTGTEKALSEALKEYKQEKDKFLKLSSEWNRRIKILEGQLKDSSHKLDRSREALQNKERECRRLDTEAKQQQQKSREQDREILKLKAVEHEYNQLKERFDDKEHELHKLHADLRQRDSALDKVKSDFEEQVGEIEREFGRERDDLENHLEEVKGQLRAAQERQSSLQDSMTSNLADLLGEKDDIIAQLEEKVIEKDHRMVDMQEELQAEMSENSQLAHSLELLQEEKQQLAQRAQAAETHLASLRDKLAHYQRENAALAQHLDALKQENAQLAARLAKSTPASDPEKDKLEKTIHALNKQVQGLQLKLQEGCEDLEHSDGQADDLLQTILIVDSELKEVNALLASLHQRFKAYLGTVSGQSRADAGSLAELVDEVGHHCLQLQETLKEGTGESLGETSPRAASEYRHNITVTAASSGQHIMEEYRGLKGKFERVVAELKKVKKEVNEVYSSYDDLEKRDKQLESAVENMKGTYRQQMEGLVQRVDQLASQLATPHSTAALQARLNPNPNPSSPTHPLQHQLQELDGKICALETALSQASANKEAEGQQQPASQRDWESAASKLTQLQTQLANASKDLQDVVKDIPRTNPESGLVSRLDGCSQKVGKLLLAARKPESGENRTSGSGDGGRVCGDDSPSCVSGVARCMQEITERIQEIGEQLDCLEDQAEDSDEEDEDATTCEMVRQRLADLCEYVKQHSTFSPYDWRLTQLLAAQKAVIAKDRLEGVNDADAQDKLKQYADRLSLESLVLMEMSRLLEKTEEEEEDREVDPVMRELSVLNSKVLSLHQKLEVELRTLCVTEAGSDVLRVQADIMAEKILLEGQLVTRNFCQASHLGEEASKEEEEKSTQHKLLAAEAIMRSQLDSYIGENLDKSCDELWSSASHLTTRSLVQGELTFALTSLKKQLSDDARLTVRGVRDLSLERLKDRHKASMVAARVYQEKMIQALAVIISKESEEMTIVEGPENVLEAVCSEISTIMERHIQRYKEKVRAAQDTHTAHLWDTTVKRLREDRELVMTALRQEHAALCGRPEAEQQVQIPLQSLDSAINGFGDIVSLRATLTAHLDFVLETQRMGKVELLAPRQEEEEEEEEEEAADRHLNKALSSFVHGLAQALQAEAQSRQSQAAKVLSDPSLCAAVVPSVPHPPASSPYSDNLMREAVFAAQTTFMMFKLKLLHEQEMDALRAARPARVKSTLPGEEGQEADSDFYQVMGPLEDVLDTKYDDETETLGVVGRLVGEVASAVKGRQWGAVEERLRQLEQKLQDELTMARQRHQVHLDLFKQEEAKVERLWEDTQQEREHFEERCSALEAELRSMSHQHDDEVERMRQDVMTAVSAIRANEEESETQLTDKVQILSKQMLLQKDKYKRFLSKMMSQLSLAAVDKDKDGLKDLVSKELKDIDTAPVLPEDEEVPPLPSQPPPDDSFTEEKSLNMEEELELLKKEKDEALAEETRNTKAALDAMRKAYEEELQHERSKYKECLTTMYNEDFVNEIRHRHECEVEKVREELKQVKMHYLSKCEDLKLLEIKLATSKQDYESHINQLILSNDHLDDMVNQEIGRLKDFIKNRPTNLTTGSATIEEELYDAQIMIRVKDAELQKLRPQVKNLENALHLMTAEHHQTMTQYLQALKETQEVRKECQAETHSVREQLDKAQHELGLRRPIRRTPSFHQRARSPSPNTSGPQRRDSTSAASEHVSRDSNRRRRIDPKDLRRSKSSPSLPYTFDPTGMASALIKTPGRERRPSQKT